MKSQADIIYNHIEKQKGDFVVPIELDNDKVLEHALIQYRYKSDDKTFSNEIEKEKAEKMAKLLTPVYIKEVKAWENKIGVPVVVWSKQQYESFELYFIRKYRKILKW